MEGKKFTPAKEREVNKSEGQTEKKRNDLWLVTCKQLEEECDVCYIANAPLFCQCSKK